MLGFLLFIVVFILVIGLIIISTVLGFIRSIFSFGRRSDQSQKSESESYEQPSAKSKIFDKNEGEYVDYEEVE
jgi:mannose/fructose/N-acetylgalactosamine-specific phosphotransferase system component IIC